MSKGNEKVKSPALLVPTGYPGRKVQTSWDQTGACLDSVLCSIQAVGTVVSVADSFRPRTCIFGYEGAPMPDDSGFVLEITDNTTVGMLSERNGSFTASGPASSSPLPGDWVSVQLLQEGAVVGWSNGVEVMEQGHVTTRTRGAPWIRPAARQRAGHP